VSEREKADEAKRAELRKLEDSLTRGKKELEQKLKDATPVTGQQKDSETLGLLVQFQHFDHNLVLTPTSHRKF
jgi:hypothetical protein